jgi:hypothetical protein
MVETSSFTKPAFSEFADIAHRSIVVRKPVDPEMIFGLCIDSKVCLYRGGIRRSRELDRLVPQLKEAPSRGIFRENDKPVAKL